MSANISLDLIGATLRQIQADQREDRLARELLQGQLARLEARMVSRDDLADVLRLFSQEISRAVGELSQQIAQRDARFDQIDQRLDALARGTS